jgi:hypothetical protein
MSIIPPPRTPIEDETRRNTFWLAYAVDRQHGSGTGWALSLDDDDIAQVFPVTMEQFELGVSMNTRFSSCWLIISSDTCEL